MPFKEGEPNLMTEAERRSCLTQEQADELEAGTPIWFSNVQHPLIAEKITVPRGGLSKAWKKNGPSPHACLSDFFETWLYNVGHRPYLKACPHCGLQYEPKELEDRPYVENDPHESVPTHGENFAWGDEFEELCPGVEKRPVTVEADKQKVWLRKDA